MQHHTSTEDSPAAFFLLTFLLSAPFYIVTALAYLTTIFDPTIGAVCISLFTFTPIAAASILRLRSGGRDGAKKLLRRAFDAGRISRRRWYLPILFLVPALFGLALVVMVVLGAELPAALAPASALPAVFVLLFLMATGEEVGWMGYAFEPLQRRRSALGAALILGVVWAVWHVPFLVFMMADPARILAQVAMLVATRVIAVWIFNNAGKSVLAISLFHAADNTAMTILPEIQTISPWGAVTVSAMLVIAAVAVTWMWGAETLARFRFGN